MFSKAYKVLSLLVLQAKFRCRVFVNYAEICLLLFYNTDSARDARVARSFDTYLGRVLTEVSKHKPQELDFNINFIT